MPLALLLHLLQLNLGLFVSVSFELTAQCRVSEPKVTFAKPQQQTAPAVCWSKVAKISAYRIALPFIPLRLFKNNDAIKTASREFPIRRLSFLLGS
jgi:hypothetical protein